MGNILKEKLSSSLVAAREGTQLPTVAPNLYLTVLYVQVVVAILLVIATKGKLATSHPSVS